MAVTILYTTQATATGGGQSGHVSTGDGAIDVAFGVPRELGGNGRGNNPEQFFAAAFATCFLGAMRYVVAQDRLDPIAPEAAVTATVGIGPRDDGGFGLALALDVLLPGYSEESARKLFERSHFYCPYTNAVAGNVAVETRLIGHA
ncbi:Ohr family peroxiredoxin [Frigidibacter oleivorans]|uniref:Ohr family peroxiredoxin n=1 Tax=Frigidibacter oleivorans TaxID=2487129 RepID=UPI000F8D5682|nr:Ohr family peroxiredoxin [Frigidibacter oleivorans]